MGLIHATAGAISGTFADQWKDFFTVPDGLTSTTAVVGAQQRGTNFGRGSNVEGSNDVITNGSKIVVPEGYGLLLMEDGAITGFTAEPGGYEWNSEAQDSQSFLSGGAFLSSTVRTSYERFKFGGRPSNQQRAFFVALKELPGNRFGTMSEIYWDDAFLRTQVGAITRGTFTLQIVDPILFVKNWMPAKYLTPGVAFDFTDLSNEAAHQLFDEVVASLAPALSIYTNDPTKGRISRIQQDSVGFGAALAQAVDDNYGWLRDRGIKITKTAIVAIEYDETSRELLRTVQRADALAGDRGASNLRASLASGVESAGETGSGSADILGLGFVANAGNFGVQLADGATPSPAPATLAPTPQTASTVDAPAEDPMTKLSRFKQMLDAGLITEGDYEAAKKQALGL